MNLNQTTVTTKQDWHTEATRVWSRLTKTEQRLWNTRARRDAFRHYVITQYYRGWAFMGGMTSQQYTEKVAIATAHLADWQMPSV